jgi:hypothetical protein
MPPGDLEDLVDRALRQLPTPRAPQTLMPRVMAAIDARCVPTSRARPWLAWPLAWQVASVTILIALGIGIARLWPYAPSMVPQATAALVWGALAEVSTFVAEAMSKASTVVSVTRIVWHALVQPLVVYVLVLVLVMCAACATFGAALGRIVLGGVPQT